MVEIERYVICFVDFVLSYSKSIRSYFTTALGSLRRVQSDSYTNSSEFTKRSLSTVVLLFLYLFVIAISSALYSIVMLIAACISMQEASNLTANAKTKQKHIADQKMALFLICLTFGSLIGIRFSRQGIRVTLWLFLVIGTLDTCAYVFGKKFGKTKILPNISPGKTLAGSVFGSLMAAFVSFLLYLVLNSYHSTVFGKVLFAITTVIVIITAQLGDAIQSMVKRHFAVKDTGSVIPGHGGIMDRMDSFLIAAPFLFLLLLALDGILF